MHRLFLGIALLALVAGPPARAADVALEQRADATVREWLAETGTPSASVAIVKDGHIVFARGYGAARAGIPATTSTRYGVASLSKAITATVILRLAEQGKLTLDEPVSKWLPQLGPAGSATLRELLTQTSGALDFWPQDYVPPFMTHAVTRSAFLADWGARPTEYQAGDAWRYSNTGYVIAAAVAERAAGQDFASLRRDLVLAPLHIDRALEDDGAARPAPDALGYTRYGAGPVRPAAKEAVGWLIGASDLVMSPSDLAQWDISLIDRSLLSAASYDAETTTAVLPDGSGTGYALGLRRGVSDGKLRLQHGGGSSGFLSENRIWPQQRAALIVFVNGDWASPKDLADRLDALAVQPSPPRAQAQAMFEGLQSGHVDRARLTADASDYFTPTALRDARLGLSPAGAVRGVIANNQEPRGGFTVRTWRVVCVRANFDVTELDAPDGRIEEFIVHRASR